jgi:hypothetical protein
MTAGMLEHDAANGSHDVRCVLLDQAPRITIIELDARVP